ncbi:MAG: inclusion body family protein [Chloroflexota bacterium]
MSKVIDILIVVDAETIIKDYGRNNEPAEAAQINSDHVFMTVKEDQALSGQGGGDLEIKANVGDILRWRQTTISLGSGYSAMLCEFKQTAGKDLIINDGPRTNKVIVPLPNPNDVYHPNTQVITDYHWNGEVNDYGSEYYAFLFLITDRHGKTQGFYSWDPKVQVNEE